MKELIDNIQKSIYGPEHYQAILTQPLRASFKYFAALALLLTVFLTIISSIPLIMNANVFVHEFPAKFFAYFPDELEVTVVNGVVSSNVAEPYFLPIPTELSAAMGSKKGTLTNIAVIDTATPFSLDQFAAYKSALWIGRDQMVYVDDGGAIKIQPIEKTFNYVLNETKLRGIESRMSPYYAYVGPLIVLAIFLVLAVGFASNIIYLLFGALIIMLVGRILKLRLSYRKAYQIGLHAITLPLLIDAMLAMSSLAFIRVQFAPTIIMLLIVYLNLSTRKLTNPIAATPAVSDDAPES